MDTQDTSAEHEVNPQKNVHSEQARINFELSEIDKDVLEALNMVVQMLKAIQALPPLMHELKESDFNTIDKALSDAYDRSKKVARIQPPGCSERPQVVIDQDKEEVVVLRAEQYAKLTQRGRQPKSLVKFFAESPLTNVELDLGRDSDKGREIKL
jgi:hypothetical protein